MIYEKAKIYSDGSHYIAIPHTTRWTKPRLKKQEKEITVDENLKPVQDKQEPITITTPNGVVLTQVEFVDGELVPVMKTVKAKGTKTTKKQVFERLYKANSGLKRQLLRAKIIDGIIAYLLKYIEKTGEKIVYSKGLPQYFVSDVFSSDVVTRIGQEDKKLLLYDDFNCIDEGCIIGKVNEETIQQMPKSN